MFRVDDEDPDLFAARTGISYDTEKNEEIVDRSYVALEFRAGKEGADALGDVDTDNITVVGHTIVGVIHPSKAPAINRNQGAPDRPDYMPPRSRTLRLYPGVAANRPRTAGTLVAAENADPRIAAQNAILVLEGRWTQYDANADQTAAPTVPVPRHREAVSDNLCQPRS